MLLSSRLQLISELKTRTERVYSLVNGDPGVETSGRRQTYFQTFFRQFDNEWKVLGDLQEPIYQEADDDENIFGFRYKMDDYEEHQLRRGTFGPEYPRSRMLGLTDRINLARLTN